MSAPGAAAAEGPEARFVAALEAELERGAARGDPVAVAVLLLEPGRAAPGAVLDASRAELPADGLAAHLAPDRIALLIPGTSVEGARARTARILARCAGVQAGISAAEAGGTPSGPLALLAAAEEDAAAARPLILVVEDDPATGEIMEVLLSAGGRFDVVVARSGSEAVAAARARLPDLAVVDLELPDVDGGTLVARLRERFGELPAIACSGKRPEDAAGAGFAAFHRKPLDFPALLGDVARVLRGAKSC